MTEQPIGVLVMAYGSPNRPEDILPYYTHIRGGRAPSPELLKDLEARYEAIGGSKLNQISMAQARSLGNELNAAGDGRTYRIYFANRHWEPWIPDVVRQMAQDGIRQAVALTLAPQGSRMSSDAYMEQVDAANRELGEPIRFIKIRSWHLEPDFIRAQAQQVEAALTRFPEATRETLPVIFTCHSLPQRILTWNDTYPVHLREMGEAIAREVGLKRIDFAYQSAGRTAEPWLGPDVAEKVAELAAQGERAVLVCAAGFISDHLEVLYDLDIDLKAKAEQLGIHFERTPMLNDHPLLARALASAVRRALREAAV
ncbi:MAG TPA: ferrochelatase [Symbiobacteriaceae bacterium]